MRKSLFVLLSVELLVAVASGQMGHVNRPAMAHAWWEWRQHPNDETRGAFERQKRITEYGRWAFSGVVFTVLAGATFYVYRLKKGKPDGPRAEINPGRENRGDSP